MSWKTDPVEKWLKTLIWTNGDVIKVGALGQMMLCDDDSTLIIDKDQEFLGSSDKWNCRMGAETSFTRNANTQVGEAHSKTSLC